MPTKPKRAHQAPYKKNTQPQKPNSQSRQQTSRQVKVGSSAADLHISSRVPAGPKPKDLKTTTIAQPPNPKTNINKNQETDVHTPTKKASFLLLPPEIRWQIYQELFHPHRVEILRRKSIRRKSNDRKGRNHDPPRPTPYRLCNRQLPPRDSQSQRAPWLPQKVMMSAFTPLPTALIFTCRLTYCETIHLFYSKMQFIFRCTKTAARFLKTTSKDSQSAIKHVELYHIMYNEPRLTEFREYKFRSDRSWYLVCDEMSQSFASLRVLHVDLAVHDWPIHLEIGERWSFPLLVFGDNGRLLDDARIFLRMPRFSKEKLRFVARSVEEKIMKPESFQVREDDRLARQLTGPVKARKILKLGF